MQNLNNDLENLRKLNALRDRAKEMRELALIPLRKIEDVNRSVEITQKPLVEKDKKDFQIVFDDWLCSEDQVEIALLVRVLNNRDINKDNDVNIISEASKSLKRKLRETKLADLFNLTFDKTGDQVPVLTAALTMQGLVSRAETVFSRASMICYYRIVRELYEANPPDWMVGAARVGSGGRASAFVTSECVRAISAFQKAIKRTNDFLDKMKRLLNDYAVLREVIDTLEIPEDHPLHKWADKTMEAIGLDCYLSTNPRRRQIAIAVCDDKDLEKLIVPNLLRIFPDEKASSLDIDTVGKYFDSLNENFRRALKNVKGEITEALKEIRDLRKNESPDKGVHGEKVFLSESAHQFAKKAIENALSEANAFLKTHSDTTKAFKAAVKVFVNTGKTRAEREKQKIEIEKKKRKAKLEMLEVLIKNLRIQGEGISTRILKTVDPSKKYLKSVIYRELSANEHDFDAGELVFAATALGAMTEWRDNDLLRRASDLLVRALPDNGKMTTRHPFHTNQSGYRLLPVEFEMSKSMAQLFEKTDFAITPETVEKILSIFEDSQIRLCNTKGDPIVGWNFLGSPNPNSPSVWATAVSVIALDRIVRMLNARINKAVLNHFEVIPAEKGGKDMKLYDLIYSDHGFSSYPPKIKSDFYFNNRKNEEDRKKPGRSKGDKKEDKRKDMSIALYLQLMRAHVMRAALPEEYRNKAGEEKVPKVFSAILYGPPGTGKTTLAEALALSSQKAAVLLSPSDLIVQGQELMEGRARDVFEALSMLTQVVIIFDEFEPVLKRRGDEDDEQETAIFPEEALTGGEGVTGQDQITPKQKPGDPANSDGRDLPGQVLSTPTTDQAYLQMVEQLRIIGSKADPKFSFLLGGMLPKFIKLNKSAKENSFVYFLGSNYLKEIDKAAQRPGRFDTKIPVYNPCPLSRAGTLLYRMNKYKMDKEKSTNFTFDNNSWLPRFLELVSRTAHEPASELAQRFFNENSDHFKHVMDFDADYDRPTDPPKPTLPINVRKFQELENDERKWLNNSEVNFRSKKDGPELTPVNKLGECLTPPAIREEKKN
jgi:DNA polymerase III delta prime subunit